MFSLKRVETTILLFGVPETVVMVLELIEAVVESTRDSVRYPSNSYWKTHERK